MHSDSVAEASNGEPVIPMNDSDKVSVLLSLLGRFHGEQARYRNYEWTIAAFAAAMTVGVLSQAQKCQVDDTLKWFLTVFVCAMPLFLSYHLIRIHSTFIKNRNLAQEIERHLELFTSGEYIEKQTVLPMERCKTVHWRDGCDIPIVFMVLVAALAAYALFSVWS
jgi:membrane protein YdbS with pleckstrin-like domain